MKYLSKTIFCIVLAAVLCWFLPWLYALMTPAPSNDPFYGFSPVSGEWVNGREMRDKALRDSLLPQIYYRDLLAKDRLQDSLNGKAMSAHSFKTHEIFFVNSPRDVVKRLPAVWLMMESMPDGVDLEDPKEIFRFTEDGRMEFVDIASNTVNPARTRRFTETLRARGFSFPATNLSANITSRKAYDEGYLMVDSEGKVFHVKQQGGRPYVAAVNLPDSVKASRVFIWEEMDRSLLGMAIDTANRPWLIQRDGYQAIPFPEGITVDLAREAIMVMGNLFNLTCRFTSQDGARWYALDADTYKLLGSLDYRRPRTTASEIADYIFPFTLSFTSSYDSLAYPRIGRFSAKALPLWIAVAAVCLIIGYRRKSLKKRNNHV